MLISWFCFRHYVLDYIMAENLGTLPNKYILYLNPQTGLLNLGDGKHSVLVDERDPDLEIVVPKNQRYWNAPFFTEKVSVLICCSPDLSGGHWFCCV